MISDESKHQPPKSIVPIFILGLIMIALFWFGSKALLSLPVPVEEEDAARSAERAQAYQELSAANDARLSSYALLDAEADSVQVPIEVAMRMAEARLNSTEPDPAGPVNPPVPVPAASPATGSTPEAEASPESGATSAPSQDATTGEGSASGSEEPGNAEVSQ